MQARHVIATIRALLLAASVLTIAAPSGAQPFDDGSTSAAVFAPLDAPIAEFPLGLVPAPTPLEGTGLLVYVASVRELLDATANQEVAHIVVLSHLDMSGTPAADADTLAVLRIPLNLQSIKGECSGPIPSTVELPSTPVEGACVIRVLHAWLEVSNRASGVTAVGSTDDANVSPHALWISNFVVEAARPAADQEQAPLLYINGADAWVSGMLLISDGFDGRGLRSQSSKVFVGGSHFSGFRSLDGAALSISGAGASIAVVGCRFSANVATAGHGASILAESAAALVSDCTFEDNGENEVAVRGGEVWTPAGEQRIRVYDIETRSIILANTVDGDQDYVDNAMPVEVAPLPSELPFPTPLESPLEIPPVAFVPAFAPAGSLSPGADAVQVPEFASADDPQIQEIRLDQEAAANATDGPLFEPEETQAAGRAASGQSAAAESTLQRFRRGVATAAVLACALQVVEAAVAIAWVVSS